MEHYKQKTYDCIFRHGGSLLHSMPLQGVTRDELKLLAYVHGQDSVTAIAFKGERQMFMFVRAPEGHKKEGQEVEMPVLSQEEEYKRLARKYDTLSDLDGIGRGRRYVESCFKVRLDDMDDGMFKDVDPVAAIEEAAARAEIAATTRAGEDAPPAGAAPSLAGAVARPPVAARA